MPVSLHVVEHPLAADALSRVRNVDTPSAAFREHLERLGLLVLVEATRHLATLHVQVQTPLAVTRGKRLAMPPVIVPVLRAGLGFLHAAQQLLPEADIGFVGVSRDESTHQPTHYVDKLPETLAGRSCIVLDPMLATGGSLAHTCRLLMEREVDEPIAVVCALAAPAGMDTLAREAQAWPVDVRVFTGSLDERLDERAFIVPGLGDAGDRLFGPC